jgi:hypothetical protein
MRAFTPGQEVIWRHVCRGGYGYVVQLPAKVVRVTAARVVIDVTYLNGNAGRHKVRPESLRELSGGTS